jgi:four helix bundle protein
MDNFYFVISKIKKRIYYQFFIRFLGVILGDQKFIAMSKENDLLDRLIDFSVQTIKFTRQLPNNTEYSVIKNQIIKSATSIGANYEESQAGISRADFHNKVRISLKECVETKYWFRILSKIINEEILLFSIQELLKEADELSRILGKICYKTRKGT